MNPFLLFILASFASAETVVPPRVVFLGDSLTAGYQLPKERAYPALVQAKVREAGLAWDVVNAGISGDTSAGALRRVEGALAGARLLVVAIGCNDGLRGHDVGAMKRNIDAILTAARAKKVPAVLVQMEIPPNYGPKYSQAFHDVYPELAKKHEVPLAPFFLEGVGGEPDLNLPDGIHPNPKGHTIIAEAVWKAIEPHLRELAPK
jgi:acyl-CoA thioesterase-1